MLVTESLSRSVLHLSANQLAQRNANANANLGTPPTPQMIRNKMVDISSSSSSSSFSSRAGDRCDEGAVQERVCVIAAEERKRHRAVID